MHCILGRMTSTCGERSESLHATHLPWLAIPAGLLVIASEVNGPMLLPGPALAQSMTDNAFHPAYFETVFTGALAAGELPAAFAIITAYAPTGQIWSEEQNLIADGRLKIRLAQWPCWRITGQTPDGSHAEPGWAVECDQATALAIGREFQQDAIYWVTRDDLIILDSSGSRPPAQVGKFHLRYVQILTSAASVARETTTGVNVTDVNSSDSPLKRDPQ